MVICKHTMIHHEPLVAPQSNVTLLRGPWIHWMEFTSNVPRLFQGCNGHIFQVNDICRVYITWVARFLGEIDIFRLFTSTYGTIWD